MTTYCVYGKLIFVSTCVLLYRQIFAINNEDIIVGRRGLEDIAFWFANPFMSFVSSVFIESECLF
jgi:hypothetical protein